MGPLELFDALLGPINPVSRVLGGISAVRHANFRRAADEGAMSVVNEIAGGLVGTTAFQFAIPIDGTHSLDDVRALLRRYGVPSFTYLHDHEHFYFSVKRTQARWAEYVLQNAGVDLRNAPFDRQNVVLAANHSPGWMPQPWSEGRKPAAIRQPKQAAPKAHGRATMAQAKDIETIVVRAEEFVLGEHRRDVAMTQATPGTADAGRTRSQVGWLDQFDAFLDRLLG